MKKQTIVRHFGSVRATADAFNLTTQAIYAWPDIVKEPIALKAEKLSNGKLKYKARTYR